jgi:hypothetical protein
LAFVFDVAVFFGDVACFFAGEDFVGDFFEMADFGFDNADFVLFVPLVDLLVFAVRIGGFLTGDAFEGLAFCGDAVFF